MYEFGLKGGAGVCVRALRGTDGGDTATDLPSELSARLRVSARPWLTSSFAASNSALAGGAGDEGEDRKMPSSNMFTPPSRPPATAVNEIVQQHLLSRAPYDFAAHLGAFYLRTSGATRMARRYKL